MEENLKRKANKFIGGEISTSDEHRECMKILSPEQQPKHEKYKPKQQ